MTPSEIDALLQSPSETLSVELKSWLDLTKLDDRAKVARALIAMRNNNGGILLFGFDNKKLHPVTADRPTDIRTAFHPDTIQGIVKDYVVPPFEVTVHFGKLGAGEFPVVTIPSGIKFPAIARQPHSTLLRQYAVYIRSANNGVVESVEPRSSADWDHLVQTCFDNREADIGRFLRRHAAALVQEIRSTSRPEEGLPPKVPAVLAPSPTIQSQTALTTSRKSPAEMLEEGSRRFHERVVYLRDGRSQKLPDRKGWRDVAVICTGKIRNIAEPKLLEELFSHHPRFTGWPAWIDSRGFAQALHRPYSNRAGWEALIAQRHFGESEETIDFWRIEAKGAFFLRCSYEDDVNDQLGTRRGKVLDFTLVIARAAEALATAQIFARVLSEEPEIANVDAAFRWTNLRDRELVSWAEPGRRVWSATPAYEDEVVSDVRVPVVTSSVALGPYVEDAVRPLFTAFGMNLNSKAIHEISDQIIQRAR